MRATSCRARWKALGHGLATRTCLSTGSPGTDRACPRPARHKWNEWAEVALAVPAAKTSAYAVGLRQFLAHIERSSFDASAFCPPESAEGFCPPRPSVASKRRWRAQAHQTFVDRLSVGAISRDRLGHTAGGGGKIMQVWKFRIACLALGLLSLVSLAARADLKEIQARGEMRHLGIPYANFVTGAGDGFDVELM